MSKRALLKLLATIGAVVTLSACGNDRNESQALDLLDAQVCNQGDVGDQFNHQTSGDFSPRNLADLGEDAQGRLASYRAAGMTRGHFVYWKEIAGRPPFDPPLDVVCQVTEFHNAEQAQAFVVGLAPRDAASTLIGWLPGEYESVAAQTPALGAAARGFEIRGQGDAGAVTVSAVVVAVGKYVRTISTGGPNTGVSIPQAIALQERVASRAD